MGWGTWESLGRPTGDGGVTSVAACSSDQGRVDVITSGNEVTDAGLLHSGNGLWHRWYDVKHPGWSGWARLEGIHIDAGDPSACSWGPGRIDVMFRSGGKLTHKWFQNEWQNDRELVEPPQPAAAPALVTWGPGTLDFFMYSADDAGDYSIYHSFLDNGWSDWRKRFNATDQYSAPSSPVAVAWAAGRIDLFISDVNGIGHWWFDRDWQTDKETFEAYASRDIIAASSRGLGRIDLLCAGRFKIGMKTFDASGWSGWTAIPGELTSPIDHIAAASWSASRIDVFAVAGGELWHTWLDS